MGVVLLYPHFRENSGSSSAEKLKYFALRGPSVTRIRRLAFRRRREAITAAHGEELVSLLRR